MGTPMLQAKIQELAERRVKMEEGEGLLPSGEGEMREKRRKEIEGALQEVAEKMVDDMICKMESKRFIRGAYYFATQLLTRAYHQGKPPLYSCAAYVPSIVPLSMLSSVLTRIIRHPRL